MCMGNEGGSLPSRPLLLSICQSPPGGSIERIPHNASISEPQLPLVAQATLLHDSSGGNVLWNRGSDDARERMFREPVAQCRLCALGRQSSPPPRRIQFVVHLELIWTRPIRWDYRVN